MGENISRPQDLTDTQLDFYIRVARSLSKRETCQDLLVPEKSGRAFHVYQDQVLRITCSHGPQVCDFNAFSATDSSEHFWSGRTRTLQGSHMKIGRQLWSTEPSMRPMMTMIADTVKKRQLPNNATTHDLIYSRCSERAWQLRTGRKGMPNCNTNIKNALRDIGFSDEYVHDAFNVFMTTGYDTDHRLFHVPSEAQKGDYIELYAEIDLVCAVSCCPGTSSGNEHYPITVQVFSQSMRPPWRTISTDTKVI